MKSNRAIIALIICLATVFAGCGGRRGGAPVASPGTPAHARSAASGQGSNVAKVGMLAGGLPQKVFVRGNYAYIASDSMLSIVNVSNPAAPVQVGFYDVPYNALAVYVSGNYAYVADGCDGIVIVDVTNPANPTLAGSYETLGDAYGIYVSGNFAYVADNWAGLQIINVTNPANPTLAGGFNTPGGAYGVYVSGNFAYVATGANGLQIINVTNPASPTLAGSYDTPGTAKGVYVSGSYAYVADGSNLQIINVSNPASPAIAGSYSMSGSADDVFVSGNYAYVADDYGGLRIINVANPASPSLAGSYATMSAEGVYVVGNYAYVADDMSGFKVVNVTNPASPSLAGSFLTPSSPSGVYVSGNYAYVANYLSGFFIYDVSNPANITKIGGYDTPMAGPCGVDVSGNYAYVAAYDSLMIFNITNLANPTLVGQVFTPNEACGIQVAGSYAYVLYNTGLAIINVANPASPYLAGSYSLGGYGSFKVSGNYAYVVMSLMPGPAGVLRILNVSNPANPTLAGSYSLTGPANDIFISGNTAYVTETIDSSTGLLQTINVANPASPAPVGSFALPASAQGVFKSGNYVYVGDEWQGLQIVNVANPASPSLAGSYATPGYAIRVFVSGNRAYVGASSSGLFILDFTGGGYNSPPVVTGCAFSPCTIAAGGAASSTLQCNVADANSNVSSVTVNLSAIGGPANAALTNTATNTWRLTGITAPATATVQTNVPIITATDSYGATGTSQAFLKVTTFVPPPNPKPVVTGCGFTPYRISAGGASTTLQCTVTDANNNLALVTVDLTSIGGPAMAALANTGGNTWRRAGITASAASMPQNNAPIITATDALGATGTSQAVLIVYDPGPVVSGCAFAPNRIPAGGGSTATLQCTVADPNNNVSSVTVDLTSIGGSANAALTNMGGNTWRLAGITASAAAAQQTNAPTITATDSHNGAGTSRATLIVFDPRPVLSLCAFTPVRIKANGVATTQVQCTVADPNNNVVTVAVNLTAIGGSPNAALTNVGGNIWRRVGITAPIGAALGTKSIATTATDASGGTGTQNAVLIIAP